MNHLLAVEGYDPVSVESYTNAEGKTIVLHTWRLNSGPSEAEKEQPDTVDRKTITFE